MKVFLFRLILFLSMLSVLMAAKVVLMPYHAGSGIYTRKLNTLRESDKPYNTFIFGSSRMYRQLDPIILDSALAEFDIVSYNLAVDATFQPESYYLYSHFLESDLSRNAELVFLELSSIPEAGRSNASTAKGSYWLTPGNLIYCWRYINSMKRNDPDLDIWQWRKFYVQSFLFRIYDFSSLKGLLDEQEFTSGKEGFYSCEAQLKRDGKKSFLFEWNKNFKQHSDAILRKKVQAASSVDSLIDNSSTNFQPHLEYLESLIDESESRDIKLVVVLPPRLTIEAYEELAPVFAAIPDSNKIDVSQYPEFEELYLLENSFDGAHLNEAGIKLFTGDLSEEAEELLSGL